MRRGLYVLFEGLADTVVDSQVLLHAREMRTAGIVDFEIWSFAWDERYERSLAKRADAEAASGGVVRVLRCVRPAFPWSTVRNAGHLDRELSSRKSSFDLIHARTDYAAAVCSRSQAAAGIDLVWDCRGDMAAETEARRAGSPIAAKIGRWVARRRVARAAAACGRAIFVSEALREVVAFSGKPFEIIPCVASESSFFFDPALRREMRRTLGYADDARVLVYSGSLEFYQCFPESVAVFRDLYEADRSWRLLVLTPEIAAARRHLGGLPEDVARVLHAPFARVNEHLNAADVALMIRRRSPVNQVASPTKFAEYCLAGLPVVMTDAIGQSLAIARELGNVIELRDGAISQATGRIDDSARRAIAESARPQLSRSACRDRYARLYRA